MTRHRIPRNAKTKAFNEITGNTGNTSSSTSVPPPAIPSTSTALPPLVPPPAIPSTSAQAMAGTSSSFVDTSNPLLVPMYVADSPDLDIDDYEPPATPGLFIPPPTPKPMRGPFTDIIDYPPPKLTMPDDDMDLDQDFSQPPPTPTPMLTESDQSEEEIGSQETEEEEEEEAAGSSKKGKAKAKSKKETEDSAKDDEKQKSKLKSVTFVYTVEQMVQNTILYMMIKNHNKSIIKRSKIIQYCMNGQTKDFPEVIAKVEDVFNKIFGIKVYGCEESTKQRTTGFVTYIITSQFPLNLADTVTQRMVDVDAKRTVLFIILTMIYMLNRSIDDESIRKFLNDLQLNSLINVKKDEDLRRFLKTEYVNSGYLNAEEIKDSDPPSVRYSWGIRSNKEVSFYKILLFVCKLFPGKKPSDFAVQYAKALELERDVVEADAQSKIVEVDMEPTVPVLRQEDEEEARKRKEMEISNAKISALERDINSINLSEPEDDASDDGDENLSDDGSDHSIDVEVGDDLDRMEIEESDDQEMAESPPELSPERSEIPPEKSEKPPEKPLPPPEPRVPERSERRAPPEKRAPPVVIKAKARVEREESEDERSKSESDREESPPPDLVARPARPKRSPGRGTGRGARSPKRGRGRGRKGRARGRGRGRGRGSSRSNEEGEEEEEDEGESPPPEYPTTAPSKSAKSSGRGRGRKTAPPPSPDSPEPTVDETAAIFEAKIPKKRTRGRGRPAAVAKPRTPTPPPPPTPSPSPPPSPPSQPTPSPPRSPPPATPMPSNEPPDEDEEDLDDEMFDLDRRQTRSRYRVTSSTRNIINYDAPPPTPQIHYDQPPPTPNPAINYERPPPTPGSSMASGNDDDDYPIGGMDIEMDEGDQSELNLGYESRRGARDVDLSGPPPTPRAMTTRSSRRHNNNNNNNNFNNPPPTPMMHHSSDFSSDSVLALEQTLAELVEEFSNDPDPFNVLAGPSHK